MSFPTWSHQIIFTDKPTVGQGHNKVNRIIAITNMEEDISEIHSCMEKLRNKLGISFISNWSSKNTIHKIGLWKWYHNNLNDQSKDAIVIFITTTDNAAIHCDWELLIANYTRCHKDRELIYLHREYSLTPQTMENPRIVRFAYKREYHETDDFYQHLLQLCS